MEFGPLTRILHALIAIEISIQLCLSLVMKTPKPGRVLTPLESLGYEAHRSVGVAVLVLLFLHWIIFSSGHAYKGIGHFFPWLSKARMHAVLSDIRELLELKVGDPGQKDSFSGAFEGLGLIVGSILAASGAVLFFGIGENGVMRPVIRAVKAFHEFWGPFMWRYLGIHAGATALHIWLGHRSVLPIFRW